MKNKKLLMLAMAMSLVFSCAAISACGINEDVDSSPNSSQTTEGNSSVTEDSSNDDTSSQEHEHVLTHKEAKAASCTEDGNIEYWTCGTCGKFYSDEACTTEITQEQTVVKANGHSATKTEAKAATCTEDGNIEYWTCGSCGKLYSDEACTTEITQEQTVVKTNGHSWKLDATDPSADKLVCDCGVTKDDYIFNKEVTVARQEFILSNDGAVAISIEGISEYTTVQSITLGIYDLGADISNLNMAEVKADTTVHGEQDILVTVVDAQEYAHIVKVPVLLVTKAFTSVLEIKEACMVTTWDGLKSKGAYYILANDMDASDAYNCLNYIVEGDKWAQGANYQGGFQGTLDGRGYAIKGGKLNGNGLFGSTSGAIIKNLKFSDLYYDSTTNLSPLFGYNMYNTTVENVTITLRDEGVNYTGGYFFAGNVMAGCTFKDVTINAKKTTLQAFAKSYTQEGFETNQYDNVVINAAAFAEDLAGVTVNVEKEVTLPNRQDIILTEDTASISIGTDYADYTIQSISYGTLDLGMDLANLDVSAVKADMKLHGEHNITVILTKENEKVSLIVPVTFVTEVLTTFRALKYATMMTTGGWNDVKGEGAYYILGCDLDASDDVGSYNGIASIEGGKAWTNGAGYGAGFMGTLDGRGYTINGIIFNGSGLFGAKMGGAIKNLNLTNATYEVSNTNNVLGLNMKDVLVENVTITFKSSFTMTGGGLLCSQQTSGCTFRNVTVNANGSDIQTLIGGGQYSGGNTNTFENVVVNAKSMKYIGYTLTTADGVTFNAQ